MQNKYNESKGAVIPYIAVLLGLLLCSGILGWFISARKSAEPMPQSMQETASSVSAQKTAETPLHPEPVALPLPDVTAVYENESFAHVKNTHVAAAENIPTEEALPTASLLRSIALTPPAGGEIIYPYSDNLPAYNETMRDWRVHNAIDIAVVPGEIAVAAADGTIDSIYEDRLLGNVIVVSHVGGYKTLYANLSEHAFVKEGDSVKQGDSLCEIGGTAVMELFLPEHLHFALWKDDQALNPEDFWKE